MRTRTPRRPLHARARPRLRPLRFLAEPLVDRAERIERRRRREQLEVDARPLVHLVLADRGARRAVELLRQRPARRLGPVGGEPREVVEDELHRPFRRHVEEADAAGRGLELHAERAGARARAPAQGEVLPARPFEEPPRRRGGRRAGPPFDLGEERLLVPAPGLARLRLFPRPRARDLARDERFEPGFRVLVSPDLEGEDVDPFEPLVEEGDDARELGRDRVGDEDEPHPRALEVPRDRRPEGLGVEVVVGEEGGEHLMRRPLLLARAACFELRPDALDRQVRDRVDRVVEHLGDHFPPRPRVAAPLHLDQRRHALAVDEEVIERPAVRPAFRVGHRHLARDEEKPARRRILAAAVEEARELGDEPLKQRFGVVDRRDEPHEPAVPDLIDRAVHSEPCLPRGAAPVPVGRRPRAAMPERAESVPRLQIRLLLPKAHR